MTAASLHPGTFGHIRGEKKGAGSIDVNYADVTREGAQWSVSPPKESITVKGPPPFFPFCRDSIVSLKQQCVVSLPMSTPTQPNSTLQLKLTSTKPQMNKSWVRKHHSLPSPAETASSPKSQMVKVTDLQTGRRMWNSNEMYELTKKVLFWCPSGLGLCLDY